MGVAKAWSFSEISANLALLHQQNGNQSPSRIAGGESKHHHHHHYRHHRHNDWWRRWRSLATQQRKKIPWSLVCGLMLFILGLISLFAGHVASDLEWYSQRLVTHSLGRLVDFRNFFSLLFQNPSFYLFIFFCSDLF